jgi:hypothetical protein
MIGRRRLRQLRLACEGILVRGVPGDFVETGVWRGGACILMQGVLSMYGALNRRVWLYDSFSGLPVPDIMNYPQDRNSKFHEYNELSITVENVINNFKKFSLLDGNVKIVKGWFKDTLPNSEVKKISLLRLDGDLYQSTMEGLINLYHKVSLGGIVIVDDYHVVDECKEAVHDFLRNEKIVDLQIHEIDDVGVFWKKS